VGIAPRSARSSADARSGARGVALKVVRRVVEDGAYSNLAIAGELDRSHLDRRDRQFATDLAYGTLRRLLILDGAIARLSSRPPSDIDPEVRAILRLGAYQLWFTRVPPHAAVSETVSLATPRSRGFVNAVLRRVPPERPLGPAGEDDDALEGRTGLAAWALRELRRVLPREEVEAAAAALASPARLSLRTNTCRVSPEALERALRAGGLDVRRGTHDATVLAVDSGMPAGLPGYGDGWFAVQDEASVLVATALRPLEGERILDACAGPGGKTADLACRVGSKGLVVGQDVHPRRADLVRIMARRLGVRVLPLVSDGRRPGLLGGFDGVLVDAPCSGLGAARRRPELLWRPERRHLARLARLQVAILTGVADLVRPGGRLVYSVCTFPRAETDAAVRAFLAKRPDFRPAAVPGPAGGAASHRLWPHRDGTDAMFYAGFRRTAAD
jgi:16S rRNA (cytosine967-C5)-methyltransferase